MSASDEALKALREQWLSAPDPLAAEYYMNALDVELEKRWAQMHDK